MDGRMTRSRRIARFLLGLHLAAGPVVGVFGSAAIAGSLVTGHAPSLGIFFLAALPGLALGIVPSNTTMLAAGAAFGWKASPFVFLTLLLASLPGFLLVRKFFRAEVRERISRHAKARAIMDALDAWEFPAAVLLRIAPVSTFAWTNAILSLGSLSLPRFLAATALGIAPRIALLTWAGESATDLWGSLREGRLDPPALVGLGLSLATLAGAGFLAARLLKEAQRPPRQP
ncbi:MAG: hypothetical protein RL318_1022 [Fibrobacterota bacterium]|jgi:uncharacterized membrane protein YdjX (TVP38/TMEM64 family)